VKTPAATQGFTLRSSPRSLPPFFFIPAAIPAAKTLHSFSERKRFHVISLFIELQKGSCSIEKKFCALCG